MEQVLSIINTIAVVVGVWVAVRGINAWREEMVGQKKAALAEEVLSVFYEIKDVFDWVRSPVSFANEGESRPTIAGETEEDAKYRNAIYVPIERLYKHQELFAKLQSIKYRFMAYFGKDGAKPFDEINNIKHTIIISSKMLIRTYNPEQLENRRDQEDWEANIGWGSHKKGENLSQKIAEAIDKIEKICSPILLAM